MIPDLKINQSLESFVKEGTENLWAWTIHEGLRKASIPNAFIRQIKGRQTSIITSEKLGPFMLAFVFDPDTPEIIIGSLHPRSSIGQMDSPIATGEFSISVEAVRDFVMDCLDAIINDTEEALSASNALEKIIPIAIMIGESVLKLRTGNC